jgi:hypothetical protein
VTNERLEEWVDAADETGASSVAREEDVDVLGVASVVCECDAAGGAAHGSGTEDGNQHTLFTKLDPHHLLA